MRLGCLLCLTAAAASAQIPAAPRDSDIDQMLASVSADRLQRSVVVLTSSKTRHTLSDPAPSGDGIGGAGAWIRAEFERVSAASGQRLKVDADDFRQPAAPPLVPKALWLTNIVATLPGARPEAAGRVYVVCAHYDSRNRDLADASGPAPGADDDASGVAAVLEMARAMARYDFGATLVFAEFTGEEQGLLGSRHWAAAARERGLRIAGVLDLDRIGGIRTPGGGFARDTVRLFCGENDAAAHELARSIRDASAVYVPDPAPRLIFRRDALDGGGDQVALAGKGFPAVRFSEAAADPERGAEGDVTDSLDFNYVAGVTRIGIAALASLARAPLPPGSVEIARAPAGGTAVRWTPSPDPEVGGYRVVWRGTTSPLWEHSMDVPKGASRATAKGVAPDDAFFGVEPLDGSGRPGPAAIP